MAIKKKAHTKESGKKIEAEEALIKSEERFRTLYESVVDGFTILELIFDFELSQADMSSIATLDMKTSSFFDHRDPEIVKWMGSRKLEI